MPSQGRVGQLSEDDIMRVNRKLSSLRALMSSVLEQVKAERESAKKERQEILDLIRRLPAAASQVRIP